MEQKEYNVVGKPFRKKDSMQLLLGKPVYVEDVTPDALVVHILRSPHPHAMVQEIDVKAARLVPGVVDIYTWKDVPQTRFAIAGQTYPEPSPYDRLILDRHVRFAGDAVAIIAAETEKAAAKAMKLIKVTYDVLEPVLDYRTALDNPILVHPEEDWLPPCEVGGTNKRNLVASGVDAEGDVEGVLGSCDIVLDRTFHTRAFQQAMMEPFTAYAEMDRYGRLHLISSTQIVFHTRRILSRALGIPKSRIRVEKPRIGGGFGAKQTAVCDVYPAFVTLKTGRPSRITYTRTECQIAGSPRHEMEIRVRLGASQDGKIRVLDLYTLSNTGAYGEHGPTTVGLSGRRCLPGLRCHPGHFRRGIRGQRAGGNAGHGPHRPPGPEYGEGGHGHARLLWRDRQRLRSGSLHGPLPGDVRLGGKVPGAGHGQWEGSGRRRGHGHAGQLHFQCGRGLRHREAQRGRHLQPAHRCGGYGHRLRHHSGSDGGGNDGLRL